MDGVLPLAASMDSAGALTRSAEDLGLVFDVLRGRPSPPLPVDVAQLRIGVPDPPPAAEPDVRDAVDRALQALQAAGAQLVPVAVPPWESWDRARGRVLIAEALAAHRAAGWYPARRERYGAQSLGYLRVAERLSDEDVATARRELRDRVDRLRSVFGAVDVLALPTTPMPAPPRDDADVDSARRIDGQFGRLCGPANAANLAAVSVPCTSTSTALPVGVQFLAPDEHAALAAGIALTRAQPTVPKIDNERPL
jgi:aspartyl-tRNA(Asn)/glutamyl-tRNA(Gln) amidotransferase subunit A